MSRLVTAGLCLVVSFFICSCSQKQTGSDWYDLFDGETLTGWHQLGGTAKYHVEDGMIVGTSVAGTPNSFLATNEVYGDFILEFDAKVDATLNSGVQFRSLSKKNYQDGRVHGYQLELDTSPRSWSGGIYDEARRGWLYSLSRNANARAAFIPDSWNHFRIEAIGFTIHTWVNDVPAANLTDNLTDKGFIALQVHAIQDGQSKAGAQVRWKNIRIKTGNLQADRRSMDDGIEEFNFIPNMLTEHQKNQGWKLLWDGKTSSGWRGAKLEDFPPKGWEINGGILSVLSSGGGEARNGGDIITIEEFSNFELEVDFKITAGANSGIKYFVDPDLLKGQGSAIGLEFQILDDELHPDAKLGVAGNRTMGSLYDLIAATNLSEAGRSEKRVNGVGQWNRARLVVRNNHVEHWLNNSKIIEYERGTQIFRALVAYSKYAEWPNFGEWEKGPILLQDHGDLVSFRSIKIKILDRTKEE